MQAFEYKVVPAPQKGTKAKGVKTPEARFAHALETLMNAMAAEGWEYQRADMLPSEERTGLTGSTTNWRNVLVFRRAATAVNAAQPAQAEPATAQPVAAPEPPSAAPTPAPAPRDPAAPSVETNDTENTINTADDQAVQDGITAAKRARATLTATRGQASDDS